MHTDELGDLGIDLKSTEEIGPLVQSLHRDDHYMFLIQQRGTSHWELEFNEIKLGGACLCFIAPGQVHKHLRKKDNNGWYLCVDPGLVSAQYREVFDTYLHAEQVISVHKTDRIFDMLPILMDSFHQEMNNLKKAELHSLLDATVAMIASRVIQSQNSTHLVGSQKYNIVSRFKQLVRKRYKELKQVKDYASLLNITPLYLNEVVKTVTGFPASYWIHQEIILEAKRLLYYTTLDVQEIAYDLGYEDPAYFSRFFKNNTGTAASAFRSENHGLSMNSR